MRQKSLENRWTFLYHGRPAAWRTKKDFANGAGTGSFEAEGWRLKRIIFTFWANVALTALYDEEGYTATAKVIKI